MIFPPAPSHTPQPRPTALHAAVASTSLSNDWVSINGWTTPSTLTTIDDEVRALLHGAGVIDLGMLCRYTVRGTDAPSVLSRLTSAPVEDLKIGESGRGLILTDAGIVVDQCDILRLTAELFFLTTAIAVNHRLQLAAKGTDAIVEDRTAAVAALALIGPDARALAIEAGFEMSADVYARQGRVRGVDTAVRPLTAGTVTGVEILYPAEDGLVLWERLQRAGKPTPVGMDGLEVIRIVNGVPRSQVDFSSAPPNDPSAGRTPIEIGMPHLAPFDRSWFNGRRSLADQRVAFRLITLKANADRVRVGGVVRDKKRGAIGRVTSSAFSPVERAAICFAEIDGSAGTGALLVDDAAGVAVRADLFETFESACATRFLDDEKTTPPRRPAL